jgi:hypothetical protein
MPDLRSIGMEKGLLYETIITSKNPDGTPNAAPIGVICKEKDEVVVYLHEGSHTVNNIKNEGRFVVNILKDPLVFVEATLGNPSPDYFQKHHSDFCIKGADAFCTVKVTHSRDVKRKDQLGVSKTTVIRARVEEIIKNSKHVEPLNRAIYGILEALVYLTRMDLVSGDMEELYRLRIREISRIVNKVGGMEHKKAMEKILEAFGGYEDG